MDRRAGRRHFFNPSNFGAAVTLLLFPEVGFAPPYHFTENITGLWDWGLPLLILTSGIVVHGLFTGRLPLVGAWIGRGELRMRKAVAFFRLGEQENCLATHNADSCVFPLKPKAYHLLPRGSRGAIALFGAHLAEYPNDLGTRWLLNLAHMTVGEYPEKVNPQYLIPPEKFASDYDLPRFPDVSDGLGIDGSGHILKKLAARWPSSCIR